MKSRTLQISLALSILLVGMRFLFVVAGLIPVIGKDGMMIYDSIVSAVLIITALMLIIDALRSNE